MGKYEESDVRFLRRILDSSFGKEGYEVLGEEEIDGISYLKISTKEGIFYALVVEDSVGNKVAFVIRKDDVKEFNDRVKNILG